MIFVDSSVWIGYLRDIESPEVRKLEAQDPQYILVGDLVLLEVLMGARDETHAAQLEKRLRRFEVCNLFDATVAISAARNYRLLRGLGVTIRTPIDLIIGTYCIAHGHALLHQDRDFDPMARHLGLRVA